MLRGELWWADLGLPQGSAPALRRPVLIVSSDKYNRSNLRTVTVATVTTNEQLAALPGNVAIPAEVAGLEQTRSSTSRRSRRSTAAHSKSASAPCPTGSWPRSTPLARALALAHL